MAGLGDQNCDRPESVRNGSGTFREIHSEGLAGSTPATRHRFEEEK